MLKLLILMMFMCALLLPGLAQAEDDVFTPQMLEHSLVSVGNTQRVQAAIAKARAGEEVTIAYLGGSITEGAQAQPQQTRCYAYLSAHAFAETYMPNPKLLKYVNAGISGTPSVLGITRLEQDVLRHEPDIVFVEFAVNDSNQMPYRIVYESMIRKLLADECQPAVVLIFTFMESGYSCQPHMQQVGSHYDLGMISVKDAIQPQITLGNITWRDYSSDYTHPNTAAHRFIAEMISNYFAKAEATPAEPWTMPETARYGKAWETLVNIGNEDERITSMGSFVWGPDRCYSYKMGFKHLAALGGNEPMVIEATCSRFTVAFKQEKDGNRGACEVWVDGRLVKTLPGRADNAWGNIITEIIELGVESAPHVIEFRMAEGDEGRNFTVLDIGIVE